MIGTEEPDNTTQVVEETTEAASTDDILAEETTTVFVNTEPTVFDDNTTAVESDNTTAAQPIVESTTERVETTTVMETTVAVPTACADSKFQCCPDGTIPAQVVWFPCLLIDVLVCVHCRVLSSKDAIQPRSGQQQQQKAMYPWKVSQPIGIGSSAITVLCSRLRTGERCG